MELSEEFTWFAPNYKFNPSYKARKWNGKISLVNKLTGYCYAGLALKIKKFCESRGYEFSFDSELYYQNISRYELEEHIKKLGIDSKFDSRDYQFESILKCIKSNRRTLLSPTSSGKSFIIYLIGSWYSDQKKLIIVPTTGLVLQFESDLRDYGFKGKIITSEGGLSRDCDLDAEIVITTWQSLETGKKGTSMPEKWFEQFDCVFGDEAHGWKANSLIKIMSKLKHCKYRFGTTGTLSDDPLSNSTIEGLFGPVYKSISTKEMIDQGYSSKLKIKCLVLKYPEDICKEFRKKKPNPNSPSELYQEEIKFITEYLPRAKFIRNLALSLKGNKLIFFKTIEHGLNLKELFKDQPNVFHIDGSVKGIDREKFRKLIEELDDAILLGSLGTTATGVNIKKLLHMIAGSPNKAKIKVLQAIGRMLRKHADKEEIGSTLYDIVDDLSIGSYQNYALKHFIERTSIYDKEQFDYKIYTIKL